MFEKMDGDSGCNAEAHVEVPVTYILWFDRQKPTQVVTKMTGWKKLVWILLGFFYANRLY